MLYHINWGFAIVVLLYIFRCYSFFGEERNWYSILTDLYKMHQTVK